MAINLKEEVGALAGRLHELYKEMVTNNAKFDELRLYTRESIDDFKRALERIQDAAHQAERDRIRVETELRAEIRNLQGRLDALSEKALHAAAKEAAREVMQGLVGESLIARGRPAADGAQEPLVSRQLGAGTHRDANDETGGPPI